MTLADKTKLINDLIRENPDATIKDFLECMVELTGIARAAPPPTIEETITAAEEVLKKSRGRWKTDERKYGQTYLIRL